MYRITSIIHKYLVVDDFVFVAVEITVLCKLVMRKGANQSFPPIAKKKNNFNLFLLFT